VKIVARTPNPLSSQYEPTETCGKISHWHLHTVEWHLIDWRLEWHSYNPL